MSSMRLPDSLESWRPWLSWFEPELAAQLGPLLLRMHPWLGRFRGHRQGGPAEPDGVEDLRRRGSYERLLSSEWLLASELPDEFLRRAATGEHLFLAPRPRARQADRLIVALFDCGPMQLGAPRLVHLALWILLARRAAEAGGALRWGSLQQPGQWHEAATPTDLKNMLRARTFDGATTAHRQAWAQWLDENATGIGEHWLVAHDIDAALRAPQAPSHAIELRRSLDGETMSLRLSAGSVARSMDLPLPSAHRTPELLKGRFENEVPAEARSTRSERFSVNMAPLISGTAAKVAVMALDGHGLLVFNTFASRKQAPGKARREEWSHRAHPLAGAFAGKSLGMVLGLQTPPLAGQAGMSQLMFWHMQGVPMQPRPTSEEFNAPPGRAKLLPCVWNRIGGRHQLYVLDAARQLVMWVAHSGGSGGTRGPMLMDRNVLAIARVVDRGVVYACATDHDIMIRALGPQGREKLDQRIPYAVDASSPAFLAGSVDGRSSLGAFAVRTELSDSRETWLVNDVEDGSNTPTRSWQVKLAAGTEVVGLLKINPSQACALVTRSATGRDISLQSAGESEIIYSTGAPIERITVCPNTGTLALITRDRQLHVVDMMKRQVRLVVHGDSAKGQE
jgi:hypothetical protein